MYLCSLLPFDPRPLGSAGGGTESGDDSGDRAARWVPVGYGKDGGGFYVYRLVSTNFWIKYGTIVVNRC